MSKIRLVFFLLLGPYVIFSQMKYSPAFDKEDERAIDKYYKDQEYIDLIKYAQGVNSEWFHLEGRDSNTLASDHSIYYEKIKFKKDVRLYFEFLKNANLENLRLLRDTFQQNFSSFFVDAQQFVLSGCYFNNSGFIEAMNCRQVFIVGSNTFVNRFDFKSSFMYDECRIEKNTFLDTLRFNGFYVYGVMSFRNNKISKGVIFNECQLVGNIEINDSIPVSLISFRKSEIKGRVKLSKSPPDLLDLSNLTVDSCEIDIFYPHATNTFSLNVFGTNLTNIHINCNQMQLVFPPGLSQNETKTTYQQMLDKLKKDGYDAAYKSIDIQYQEYNYTSSGRDFINFIQKHWWNYGYDKGLIIRNTLILFGFFSLINIFIFKRLLLRAYPIENISKVVIAGRGRYSTLKNIPLTIAYTFIIFFGLKLSVENMHFRRQLTLLYILSVYSIGLVCGAFLLGYILNR